MAFLHPSESIQFLPSQTCLRGCCCIKIRMVTRGPANQMRLRKAFQCQSCSQLSQGGGGGVPILRHNEVRDPTASLLRKYVMMWNWNHFCSHCQGRSCSFALPSLTMRPERISVHVVSGAPGMRKHSWMSWSSILMLSRTGMNLLTPVNGRNKPDTAMQYEEQIREIEHAPFSPLIFSTSAGMSRLTSVFYKRLTHLLSVKKNEPYSCVIRWLRCRLGFALLRVQIMCLRGSRSLHCVPDYPPSTAQYVMKGCIPPN